MRQQLSICPPLVLFLVMQICSLPKIFWVPCGSTEGFELTPILRLLNLSPSISWSAYTLHCVKDVFILLAIHNLMSVSFCWDHMRFWAFLRDYFYLILMWKLPIFIVVPNLGSLYYMTHFCCVIPFFLLIIKELCILFWCYTTFTCVSLSDLCS